MSATIEEITRLIDEGDTVNYHQDWRWSHFCQGESNRLKGYTKANFLTIASEADPEDWVTTLRCPKTGWTFRVVWHCPVDT